MVQSVEDENGTESRNWSNLVELGWLFHNLCDAVNFPAWLQEDVEPIDEETNVWSWLNRLVKIMRTGRWINRNWLRNTNLSWKDVQLKLGANFKTKVYEELLDDLKQLDRTRKRDQSIWGRSRNSLKRLILGMRWCYKGFILCFQELVLLLFNG